MVDGWDPATEYSDGIIAMSEMYETLTRYNSATNTVGPMLATSWSSADGGKTWTFHLRHGVTFHTGRPMTAQAAKASILRTIKLNGGASYVWAAVKTIDTPDQYTLVFHLSYASPLALQASADYSAYIYDTQAGGGRARPGPDAARRGRLAAREAPRRLHTRGSAAPGRANCRMRRRISGSTAGSATSSAASLSSMVLSQNCES